MTLQATKIVAGDSLNFTTAGGDYPASAGWSLVYKLIPLTTGTPITITSAASGDDHLVQVSTTTTAAYTAGQYSWVCYATKSGERQTLQQGQITIQADPSNATALDGRSFAAKTIAAIESWMQNRDPGVAEYTVQGRAMKYWSPADLLKLRNQLQAELRAETAAAALARGENIARRIQFRV